METKLIRKNIMKITIILFLAGTNCVSYSFRGGAFPEHTKTIHIPISDNQSTMYGLEQPLTSAVRNEFIKDGRLGLSDDQNADLYLQLTILSYAHEAYSYTAEEEVKEYQVTMNISVFYLDQLNGDTIWDDKVMVAKETYSAYNEDEEIGKNRVLEEFAKDLIPLMTENW